MIIRRRIYVVMIAALILSISAQNTRAEGVRVKIDAIGGVQCSQILTDFKEKPIVIGNAVTGWVFGYMARRNAERATAKRSQVDFRAQSVTQEYVLNVIIKTCDKHPELRLFEVAEALYGVLIKKSDGPRTS